MIIRKILLSLGISFLLIGNAYPYAIVNDKNSVASATIYIFKDKDKYLKLLKAEGVPDSVLKYAEQISKYAPAVGTALAAPTGGVSLVVAEAFPISVEVVKAIVKALQKTGVQGEALRKFAGVIAFHKDVKAGNQGRGAEWNWASIKDQYGKERGSQLYVVVTDKEKGIPLLQTTIATDGLMGFTIKKDDQGRLYAVESAQAKAQYVPAK